MSVVTRLSTLRHVPPRDSDPLPLQPPRDPPTRPTPAPAWVAFATAWLGLIMLGLSIVFIFLPGSQQPREELERLREYSPADRFLPWPLYGITVTLFLGIVVLWQMRKEPRPLPDALVAQRAQAWVGIVLALIATVIIYVWVGLFGPR